jgi:hypothetical protein
LLPLDARVDNDGAARQKNFSLKAFIDKGAITVPMNFLLAIH